MKVLMVETFLPNNRYSLELAKYLNNIVDLTLFSKTTAGYVGLEINCKKELFAGDDNNRLLSAMAYFRGIMKLNRELKKNYDVIHVQTFRHTSFEIQIYLRSKRREQILVHTVHNILPHEGKSSDQKLYQRFYDACDLLIAHNERTKNQLITEFNIPVNKIQVVAHGIYGEPIANIKAGGQKINFLMFGFIRKYKGVDVFIKAISFLPQVIRNKCSFIIAGKQYTDKDSTDYEAMAKELNVDSNIQFVLRRIEDEELPELFANADVCVFPYKEIYGSGSLLMAYTYQKPVIVSNVPTFIEETENGKTGLLFENENPQSLAEAIERFVNLDDQRRKSYSDYIAKLVNEKYNWAASAKKTAEAYEKALQNRRNSK